MQGTAASNQRDFTFERQHVDGLENFPGNVEGKRSNGKLVGNTEYFKPLSQRIQTAAKPLQPSQTQSLGHVLAQHRLQPVVRPYSGIQPCLPSAHARQDLEHQALAAAGLGYGSESQEEYGLVDVQHGLAASIFS